MNYINEIKKHLDLYLTHYLIVLQILSITITSFSLYYHLQPITKIINRKEIIIKAKVDKKLLVDIKGAVINPGVYEISTETIVNDVIHLAGGLKKEADTTLLNLSKPVSSNMVIIVYTKSEMKARQEVTCPDQVNNACIEAKELIPSPNLQITTAGININTASKDELMTLPGIGETKANAIITYRQKNPFLKIEDIMNVAGIGASTYDQIKESIII